MACPRDECRKPTRCSCRPLRPRRIADKCRCHDPHLGLGEVDTRSHKARLPGAPPKTAGNSLARVQAPRLQRTPGGNAVWVSEASRTPRLHLPRGAPGSRPSGRTGQLGGCCSQPLVALAAAALADCFGQRPSVDAAVTPAATLRVQAPDALRGGLMFQARFLRSSRASIPVALASSSTLAGSRTCRSTRPRLSRRETSEGGNIGGARVSTAPAGQDVDGVHPVQGEPMTVGRQTQDVILRDGGRRIAAVERSLTVFP